MTPINHKTLIKAFVIIAFLVTLLGCGASTGAGVNYYAFGVAIDGVYYGRLSHSHLGQTSSIISNTGNTIYSCPPDLDCRGPAIGKVNGFKTLLLARWELDSNEGVRDFVLLREYTTPVIIKPFTAYKRSNCYGSIYEDRYVLCYSRDPQTDTYEMGLFDIEILSYQTLLGGSSYGETSAIRLDDGTYLAVARNGEGRLGQFQGQTLQDLQLVKPVSVSHSALDVSPWLTRIDGKIWLFWADRGTLTLKAAKWTGSRFGQAQVVWQSGAKIVSDFGYPSYSDGQVWFNDCLDGANVELVSLKYP